MSRNPEMGTDLWEAMKQMIGFELGRDIEEQYFGKNTKFKDTQYQDTVMLPAGHLKLLQLLREWQRIMHLEDSEFMNSAIERVVTQGINKTMNRLHSSIRVPMIVKERFGLPKFVKRKTTRNLPDYR